ncbi:MAG: pyridoxal-phosphate dependent enzyme [Gammaproteobacteria bacterium]|nr:pyridoxal-phosphate dependent enzyme [Gammaproteobacteria bacterium]
MGMPTLAELRAAAERIAPHAVRTPVLRGRGGLDELAGAALFFKCENFQRCGAFKFRGALNVVLSLTAEALAAGVATHSSGNHAAALALAARIRGVPAHVVMPENAVATKRQAVLAYGAHVYDCAPTLAAREETLAEVVRETGARFVPPYDDWGIIAGAGTAALELLDEIPGLDLVLAPVGGGGLVAGSAIATRALNPAARMIAVEPAGADDARRSWLAQRRVPQLNPVTIADGLRTSLGERNFQVMQACVDDVVTVSEEAIVRAMRLLWQRLKVVVEPSAAVPFAALLEGCVDAAGKRVGVILSGGNVDLDALPWRRAV